MKQETFEMIEERVVQTLNNLDLHGMGSEAREAAIKEICSLVEKLNESERVNIEAWDKEERRRIEEEKNQNAENLERVKQEVSWKRFGLDMSKAVVPIIVSGIIYGIFHVGVMYYEEHGRMNSTMGRELLKHLPRW